jgi:hypothetical protein
LKKHLNPENNRLLIFFTAVLLSGCGKEPPDTDYVAKVNDSYLMEKDVPPIIDTSYEITESPDGMKEINFYREEIIRNWIDKELLYQQAVKEKITSRDDFRNITEDTRKTLAGAMLLRQVSDGYDVVFSTGDLEKFYQNRKEDFKLIKNSYLLNVASFGSEEEAIKFRNIAIQTDWSTAIKRSEKEAPVFIQKTHILTEEDEIYPVILRNILRELNPHEISIVIKSAPAVLTVAQVVGKYSEGTIPPFNLIKEKVEKRFVALEKQRFINGYIKSLYADNDIEVKN